jgi:thiazole/oxazole-forming peptide maturase SagD family component
MPAWYESRFTGLFTLFVRVALRPHDPSLPMTAGEMPAWNPGEPELGCAGAGWTTEESEQACVGEAIERWLARALPRDASLEATWNAWPLDEPAVDPARWVLFHSDQYGSREFPFAPLTCETMCRWVCAREAITGAPVWVPEELVFLVPRPGECQRHTFGFSTGLSSGRVGDPVLLRGAQEVIERDALVGGWWGVYPVEEWPVDKLRALLGEEEWRRVDRPNLSYRFYHIRSPFSSHVTLVSVSGLDHEGWVFSVGSACRETRRASWMKSLLEAVQGRHCVRRLLAQWQEAGRPPLNVPTTFFEHALFYAVHPQRLSQTILERAGQPTSDPNLDRTETLCDLQSRLGADHPILFRNLTPPSLAIPPFDWLVLRVMIPGLQPLHGDHGLPFLGGPLWRNRTVTDWATVPPHPFA